MGRFISRDPKEELAGLNLYAFVHNNPINKWDYLGMTECGEQDDEADYGGAEIEESEDDAAFGDSVAAALNRLEEIDQEEENSTTPPEEVQEYAPTDRNKVVAAAKAFANNVSDINSQAQLLESIGSDSTIVLTVSTQSTGQAHMMLPGSGTHSWLTMRIRVGDDVISEMTFGTYGNSSGAQGALGLNINSELNNKYNVTEGRAAELNRDEMLNLFSYLSMTKEEGAKAWTRESNCSTFAAGAWNFVTGEKLKAGSPYNTPAGLGQGIISANGGTSHGKRG